MDIQEGYDKFISKEAFLHQLNDREAIDLDTYVSFMTRHMNKEKNHQLDKHFKPHTNMRFVLDDLTAGHRKYKKIA